MFQWTQTPNNRVKGTGLHFRRFTVLDDLKHLQYIECCTNLSAPPLTQGPLCSVVVFFHG